MSGSTEGIDLLSQRISELPPDQIPGVIAPLLDYGRTSTVGRMISSYPGLTSKVLGVLGSIEGAIGLVEDVDTRTILGERAVGAVIDTVKNRAFQTGTFSETLDLVEQAGRYAELIEDPKERAGQFREIATGVSSTPSTFGRHDETGKLNFYTSIYIAKASEAASYIQDPADRSFALTQIAESSAESIGHLVRSDQVSPELLSQPEWLYEQALQATVAIRNPSKRHEQSATLALSMAKSAARIRVADTELSDRLGDKSEDGIAEILTGYKLGGEYVRLKPADKSYKLVELGLAFAGIINKDLQPSRQNATLRKLLIIQTVNLFRAAGTYADQIPTSHPRSMGLRRLLPAFSEYASIAASKLINTDPEVATELFTIGFGLAVIEDKFNNLGQFKTRAVADSIARNAINHKVLQSGLELFSLAHQLELDRLPENHVSDMQRENARRCFTYLEALPYEEITLDGLDKDFVEFLVKASKDEDGLGCLPGLTRLGRHIGDPALKNTVGQAVQDLQARRFEANRPTSEIARLAQQLFDQTEL